MELIIAGVNLTELNEWSVLLRLVLSGVLGAVLGLERTRKLRPAGLRTYMLVCIGSCVVMLSGLYMFEKYGPGFDPARMAAQVVSGIGFLGAGTIMVTANHKVKGLTTAAGLWAAACLGIAVGLGFYIVVAGGFLLLLITMSIADRLENLYYYRLKRISIYLVLTSLDVLRSLIISLKEEGILFTSVEFTDAIEHEGIAVSAVLRMKKFIRHDTVIEKVMGHEDVIFAERLDT